MSTSISGLGNNSMMMQGMGGMRRPDPGKMADDLFSKLDSSGQGYITESDLQGAFDKVSSSSSSGSSSNASELFSKLDSDSDGKVTKDEFSNGLKQVAEELDSQFMTMRMNGGMQAGGMGGMPPPPPQEGGSGFTQDELQAQLDEIGSSDSERASLISKIVENFDEADADGDGKVSFQEAMAYDQSTSSAGSASSSSSTDTAASASDTDTSAKLAMQIMQLMEAYGLGGNHSEGDLTSLLSVTA